MRDPKRIPKILDKLGEVWKEYPDLRFGQLILNVFEVDGKVYGLYHLEDENLIKALKAFYRVKE